MARTAIAGSSFIITSAVSRADLEALMRYRPAALTLTNPETKETTFRVDVGSNGLTNHGISFGGTSNCDGRFATVTMAIPEGTEDVKEYVFDTAGVALVNLAKIESGIAEVLREVRTERETIKNAIEIIA